MVGTHATARTPVTTRKYARILRQKQRQGNMDVEHSLREHFIRKGREKSCSTQNLWAKLHKARQRHSSLHLTRIVADSMSTLRCCNGGLRVRCGVNVKGEVDGGEIILNSLYSDIVFRIINRLCRRSTVARLSKLDWLVVSLLLFPFLLLPAFVTCSWFCG